MKCLVMYACGRSQGTGALLRLVAFLPLMAMASCGSTRFASPGSSVDVAPVSTGALLFENLVSFSFEEDSAREWNVDAPRNIRPCCAFGYDLRVQVGFVPLPGFRMENVVEVGGLGEHHYDPSPLALENAMSSGFLSSEVNGLMYTCRGGFVDIAHVRDYADWTFYLTGRIEEVLDTGGVFEVPREGGRRLVYVAAPGARLIERVGRRDLAIVMAQWLAFRMSIWHETATWYHWSTWSAFPEEASAFSPEDFYSNLLGIKIAGEIIRTSSVITKRQYNANMDLAMNLVLSRLGAMPASGTRHAADAVDGFWWDSSERLPNKRLVLRRNFDLGPLVVPWMVPRALRSPEMERDIESHCAPTDRAVPLVVQGSVEGIPMSKLVRLDIRIEDAVAARMSLEDPSTRWVSQDDVSEIASRARAANEVEFGRGADRPD